MHPDDVAEQIERFAGYLRIRDEDGRVAPLFEGEELDWTPDPAGVPHVPLPSTEIAAPPVALPPLRPYAPAPDPAPQVPALDPIPAAAPAAPVPMAELPIAPLLPPPPLALAPPPLPFPGIEIVYAPLGSNLIAVAQRNLLEDADTVLANPAAGRPDWGAADPAARAAALEARAEGAAPPALTDLRAAAEGPVALMEALTETLDARAEAGPGWAGTAAAGPGIWVDGALVEAVPERPDLAVRDAGAGPARPGAPDAEAALGGDAADGGAAPARDGGRNGLEDPGLEAVLGGNRAEAAATIRDLNDVSGTIVVMGDVHDLSLIWQTNMLSDRDAARVDDAGALPEAVANTVSNLARFEDAPAMVAPGAPSLPSMALRWNVDVVEGDLIDVHTLIQHNELRDGDLVVHHQTTGFSRLVTGENESFAEAELIALGDYYDVMVVGGQLVRANLVFQSNLVIDDDVLRAFASEEGGAAGDGNLLWNDALIHRSGADAFVPLTEAGRTFHDALARGDQAAEAPFELPVHGGGAAALRILYVAGDYIDVNAISQTTVIHDADVALQFGLEAREMHTGGNVAANAAVIVDSRGQGDVAMTGGTHYDDDLLIQTNIVAEDPDVRIVDSQTLASEVIAFLDPEKLPEAVEDGPFGAVFGGDAGDVLGGVMA